ncbi:MAG: cyclase family protein [bacterium]
MIIDISWPITPEMTTYKDSKFVRFERGKIFEHDSVRDSTITVPSHTGTHIDAAAHFLKEGKTVEHISFDYLVGPCRVLDLTHVQEKVTASDLQNHDIQKHEILLLKTKNSQKTPNEPFDYNFVYLDKEAASYLVKQKIKTVGIDYLGIERNQTEHETHSILFEHDSVIIEGLRLGHIEPGPYMLWCLPLAVQGLEAVPVRAVLIKE